MVLLRTPTPGAVAVDISSQGTNNDCPKGTQWAKKDQNLIWLYCSPLCQLSSTPDYRLTISLFHQHSPIPIAFLLPAVFSHICLLCLGIFISFVQWDTQKRSFYGHLSRAEIKHTHQGHPAVSLLLSLWGPQSEVMFLIEELRLSFLRTCSLREPSTDWLSSVYNQRPLPFSPYWFWKPGRQHWPLCFFPLNLHLVCCIFCANAKLVRGKGTFL